MRGFEQRGDTAAYTVRRSFWLKNVGPSEGVGFRAYEVTQVSDDRDMDQGKAVVVGNGQIMIYFEGRAFETCPWI